jgi:hypothetical protein
MRFWSFLRRLFQSKAQTDNSKTLRVNRWHCRGDLKLEDRASPGSFLITFPDVTGTSAFTGNDTPAVEDASTYDVSTSTAGSSVAGQHSAAIVQNYSESASLDPATTADPAAAQQSVETEMDPSPPSGLGSDILGVDIGAGVDDLTIELTADLTSDLASSASVNDKSPELMTASSATSSGPGAPATPSVTPAVISSPSDREDRSNTPQPAQVGNDFNFPPEPLSSHSSPSSASENETGELNSSEFSETAADENVTVEADGESVEPTIAPPPAIAASATPATTVSCGFTNGLEGWQVAEHGGTPAGQGTVVADNGSALMREGDSFLVTLAHSFQVPENPGILSFTYADLSFDMDNQDSIHDAFEAALVDGDGHTLVLPFDSNRDAFFNLSEGEPPALGSGTTLVDQTVTVDVSGLYAGTSATLIFRQVNNDQDVNSSIRISDVQCPASDDEAPLVSIGLVNDTAPAGPGSDPLRKDLLTNDATVRGMALDDVGIALLEIQVDGGAFQDITALLSANAYEFDPSQLAPGPHTITVRGTDTSGQSKIASLDFKVNQPPVANAGGDQSAPEGSTLTFDASASFDAEAPIFAYSWDFGGGDISDQIRVRRDYPQDLATFPVTLTVTDTAGSIATQSINVSIQNLAPLVDPVADRDVPLYAPVLLLPRYADEGVLDEHTATVDWGDGTTTTATTSGQNGQGVVIASHAFDAPGMYNATLSVSDGGTQTDVPFEVMVQASPNEAPVVEAGTNLTADEGATVIISPTFTDGDADDTHTATINWGDGSAVENIDPATVTSLADRPHVYAENGEYQVTVTVTDAANATGSDTLTVTVNNAPPVFELGSDVTINEGDSFNLSTSFRDAGSQDTHTATINWGDNSPVQNVDSATSPLTASHTYVDNDDYTLSVSISDDEQATANDSLVVMVQNVPPQVDAGANQSITLGQQYELLATFTDPGILDTHTATIDWGDGSPLQHVVPENNSLTAGHHYDRLGTFDVEVTVRDNDEGEGLATVAVTVGIPFNEMANLDLVDDGIINILEMSLLVSRLGSEAGTARYREALDLNADGVIDYVGDLSRLISHFAQSGIPTSPTAVRGVVIDGTGVPLRNVHVQLGSNESFTDANGHYILPVGADELGENWITFDGSEVIDPTDGGSGDYPTILNLPIYVNGGTENLFRLIPLPERDLTGSVVLTDGENADLTTNPDGTTTAVVREQFTVSVQGASLTIPAGATLTVPAGESPQLSVTRVNPGLMPVPLPPGQSSSVVYTFQPAGTVIDLPIGENLVAQFSNDDGYSAGDNPFLSSLSSTAPTAGTLQPTVDLTVVDTDTDSQPADPDDTLHAVITTSFTFGWHHVGIAGQTNPLTTVTGAVVDPNGDPVEGAKVFLAGKIPVTTGTDGSFTIARVIAAPTGPLGAVNPFTLNAVATDGTRFGSSPETAVPGDVTNFTITLQQTNAPVGVPASVEVDPGTIDTHTTSETAPQPDEDNLPSTNELLPQPHVPSMATGMEPIVTALLVNDTVAEGTFNADGETSDPTIAAAVGGAHPIVALRAGFATPTVELTATLVDGTYLLDLTQLNTIFGSPLPDGHHTLRLQAEDDQGNLSEIFELPFQLDRLAPVINSFDLAAASDSDPAGDMQTTLSTVTLAGNTDANVTVVLAELGLTTTSDDQGDFSFADVPLAVGANQFPLDAVDTAGNQSDPFSKTITRIVEGDIDPPVISARLANDTGTSNSDKLTSDPTITGTVTDSSAIASLRAGVDKLLTKDFVDVLFNRSTGNFTLNLAQLETIARGRLADGPHTLNLQAKDARGNTSTAAIAFTLDRTQPTAKLSIPGVLSTSVTSFDVNFSEPVTNSAFELSRYSLTITVGPESGQSIPIQSLEQLDSQSVHLTLDEPLKSLAYSLAISTSVADLSGNPLGAPTSLPFTVAEPVGIAEFSPFNGEELVNVTREVIVRFAGEIDPATVTAESFYLIANGQRVPGNIRVSSTRRFITLFPDSPLPASTEVRVVVDGNQILTAGGLPLDADGDGQHGGQATADFRTLPLTRIEGTNITGFVFDSMRRNSDGTNVPLVGATIRVDAFPAANAVTNEDGQFTLVDMPAPEFFVHVDGTTATHLKIDGQLVPIDAGTTTYPSVGKPFHSSPGQSIPLRMPPDSANPGGVPFDIFLPAIDLGDVQSISSTEDVNVGFGPAGLAELAETFPSVAPQVWQQLAVTFPAGSAINEQGTAATEAAIVPVPPDRIPAPLPNTLDPELVISIQAGGATNFDVPAPITFPNLEGLAPGEKTIIFSFNHDAGRWDPVGPGTVSEDGTLVVSDPGVGILAPGWHVIQQGVILRGNLIVGQRGGLFGRSATDELSVQTGRHFYALENLDNGFVIRGLTDVVDRAFDRVILSARTRYRLSVFGLVSGQTGSVEFETSGNGSQITAPIVQIRKQDIVDSDGDRLHDQAEKIVGTAINNPDTDSDGIRDLSELLQGLSPFDNRPFPTGIVSTLPLFGSANEVILEGSTEDPEGLTAYVATSTGLAIVDGTQFDNPIVLGQLALGNATDVAVDPVRQIAAVTTDAAGLQLVDVSDPMLPTLRETIEVIAGSVEVIDSVAYVSSDSKIRAYDLLTGDLLEATRQLVSGTIIDLAREGSMLYLADNARNVRAVDASGFEMVPRDSLQLPKSNTHPRTRRKFSSSSRHATLPTGSTKPTARVVRGQPGCAL